MNSDNYAVITIIGISFIAILSTLLITKNYKIISRFTYENLFYIKKYIWIFTTLLINTGLCILVYYSSNLNVMIYIILFLKLKDIIMVILFVITNLVNLYKYIINKIIPNDIVIDNKNLVAFVPAYSESLEDVNNTVNSIINNTYNNENNNLLICIVSDGKNNYNRIYNNQYYTTYTYTYKSWLNKPIQMNISYGSKDNNKIMIIHKQENIGKKDSIILVNMLFNSNTIIRDNINMKFKNDVLNNVIQQFDINKFDYLFCTDADSTISSNTFIELINSIESNDAIASCGIVNVNLDDKKNIWSYLQNFQYMYGQYMRRTVETLFKQVLCLPGCITMLKLNKNLAESMVEYSKIPNNTKLIESTIQYMGTDRRLTGCIIYNSNMNIVLNTNCHVYTNAPLSLTTLTNQRKRWYQNTYFNTLMNIYSNNINILLRFFNLLDFLKMTLVYFRFFNTLYFIYILSYYELKKNIIDFIPFIIIITFPIIVFFIYALINNHLRKHYLEFLLICILNKVFILFYNIIISSIMFISIGSSTWHMNNTANNTEEDYAECNTPLNEV
jgi:cellulose synthase/poly-beta-1,6-N-acetylglucosamine synthase-like glycosyltransferase